MGKRLIIGIIILIICCILGFLIPKFWSNNCRDNICLVPIERRITMEWYWIAAIVTALAGLVYWFFIM